MLEFRLKPIPHSTPVNRKFSNNTYYPRPEREPPGPRKWYLCLGVCLLDLLGDTIRVGSHAPR